MKIQKVCQNRKLTIEFKSAQRKFIWKILSPYIKFFSKTRCSDFVEFILIIFILSKRGVEVGQRFGGEPVPKARGRPQILSLIA